MNHYEENIYVIQRKHQLNIKAHIFKQLSKYLINGIKKNFASNQIIRTFKYEFSKFQKFVISPPGIVFQHRSCFCIRVIVACYGKAHTRSHLGDSANSQGIIALMKVSHEHCE